MLDPDHPIRFKQPGLLHACWAVMKRDLFLAVGQPSELLQPLFFVVLVVTLFPLSIGPNPDLLEKIAAGMIWVAALLASELNLERLFRDDFKNGTLDVLITSGHSLPAMVLAKVVAHWLITGLPISLIAVVMAAALQMQPYAIGVLFVSLLLGTPILALLGSIGIGLTVSVKRGGFLLALLMLPLYIPVLIFGAGAVGAVAAELPAAPQLYLLAAMLFLAIPLCPLAAAGALKIAAT